MTDPARGRSNARWPARKRVRILCALAALTLTALGVGIVGIPGIGSAETQRPGTPLPEAVESIRPSKSKDSVQTIHSHGRGPFLWSAGFTTARPSGSAQPGALCAFAEAIGPLERYKGGAGSGGGTGGRRCGPMNPRKGLAETVFIKSGSIKQVELGTTESWQAFDIGVVAFPPFVKKARLSFAGGGSLMLSLRRLPKSLRPESWEPFRYVSFGVYGCVSELEGMSKGKVVARVHESECNG